MASPEKQLSRKTSLHNVPFLNSEIIPKSHQHSPNDNDFLGFSSEDYEKSSSRALCSKFFINHRERISKELEQRILLRNGLSCLKCQLTFSSTTHLSKHFILCGKFSIFVPGTLVYLTQNVEQLRDTVSGMLICPWCPVLSAHLPALLKHIHKCKEANRKKNEKEVRPLLSCPECPVGYLSLLDLLYHLQCHYIGDIECSRCSSSFATTSSLLTHLQKCDMNKVFTCGDCENVFSNSIELQDHLRTCESMIQCLKCAEVVGSRRIAMDHVILHLSEEWSKLGLEMDDGIFYKLPSNNQTKDTTKRPLLPRHKFRRRKKKKVKWQRKKSHTVPIKNKTLRPKKKVHSEPTSENLQNILNNFVTNIQSNSSEDSVTQTEGTKSSAKHTFSSDGNMSDLEDQCTGFGSVSSDETVSADDNFFGEENELYEIENDAGDSEFVTDTETFTAELLSNNLEADINDKDPLESDTNNLFTPSLEGTDGLTLTVVNVEGGANLFNWDDENDSHFAENPTQENFENITSATDCSMRDVITSCDAPPEETCDTTDGNDDRDSGIEGTEDGDSNRDKAEDFDNHADLIGHLPFSTENVLNDEVSSLHNVHETSSDMVQFEEVVVNSEVVVSSEVTVSSDSVVPQHMCASPSTFLKIVDVKSNLKPKRIYSVIEEHSYCLPKGQTLPWFKIRALTNKQLRAQKKAECVSPSVGQLESDNPNTLEAETKSECSISNIKLETDHPNNVNDPEKLIPEHPRKIVNSSRINPKIKTIKSILTRNKLSKSMLNVSAKKALKTLRKTSLIKRSERTVFGEVCENLLLMAPENSSVKEHLNSCLERESSHLSSVGQHIHNDSVHEDISNLSAKDSIVLPIKLDREEREKKEVNFSTLASSPSNITVEKSADIPNISKCSDSVNSLDLLSGTDTQDPFGNIQEDQPNPMQSQSTNAGNLNPNISTNRYIFVSPDKVKLPASGKVIFPPGLVPLVQDNTLIGYCLASSPLPNSSVPNLELPKAQEPTIVSNEPEETPSNTTSSNLNVELQKSFGKPHVLVEANSPSTRNEFCPIVTCNETNSPAVSKSEERCAMISSYVKEAKSQTQNILGTTVLLSEDTNKLFSTTKTDVKSVGSVDMAASSSLMQALVQNDKPIIPIRTKSFANMATENSLISQNSHSAKSRDNILTISTSYEKISSEVKNKLLETKGGKASNESEKKLRHYRKEQSMLSRGFKQIATSFPWKTNVSSTTNPLEEIFVTSESSKSSLMKNNDEKILTLDPNPSLNVLSSEGGLYKASLIKMTSELYLLCGQAGEAWKDLEMAVPHELDLESESQVENRNLIKEVNKLLLKYKKILNDVPTSVQKSALQQVKTVLEEDIFKTGLKDFLADLLSLVEKPCRKSGTDFLSSEKDDILTAGLRQLITKCSDALSNLNSKTTHDSGLKISAPTQSLMFVVASDGSLQPHPNFQLPPINPSICSKENLPPAFQSTGSLSCDTLTHDFIPTEKPTKETMNVFAPPVKTKLLESVLKKTVEEKRNVFSSISETKVENVKIFSPPMKSTQLESVLKKTVEETLKISPSIGDAKEKKVNAFAPPSKTKLLTSVLKKAVEEKRNVSPSISELKEERSKKTPKDSNSDVFKALQSVPNLEHYDVVLMSSSDEDSDGDFNFESCSSPTNLHEDALENNSTLQKEELFAKDTKSRSSPERTDLLAIDATEKETSFDSGALKSQTLTNKCNEIFSLGESVLKELNHTKSDGVSNSNRKELPDKIMKSGFAESSSRQQSKEKASKLAAEVEEACHLVIVDLASKKENNDEVVNESKLKNNPQTSVYSNVVHVKLTETKSPKSKVANIAQTSECNNVVRIKFTETGTSLLKEAKIPQTSQCKSPVKIKLIEASTHESDMGNISEKSVCSTEEAKVLKISTQSNRKNSPQTSLCNSIVQTKQLETSTPESDVANIPHTSVCTVQTKLLETSSSQDKFASLKDTLTKEVKTSSDVMKAKWRKSTNVVGRRKWLSHFRVNSFPHRKIMPEMKSFRRREMGREGLHKVTKTYSFSCRQCPLWFYTQRDLERLHVCARRILEKKFTSEQYDRFFDGEINHGMENTISKLKESEENKDNCKLQEAMRHEEQKCNSETKFIKEKVQQEENSGLSPFETYVKMKKMRHFICDKCPLSFKSFNTLHEHKTEVHTEILSLICHICGKQFSRLQKLAVHCAKSHKISMKSEDYNKSLPVNATNSSSSGKQSMKKENCSKSEHEIVEAKKEELLPMKPSFACKICNRVFLGSGGLQSHINQAHSTLHKCPSCPRRFTYLEKLQKHCLDFHSVPLSNLLKTEDPDKSSSESIINPSAQGIENILSENFTDKQVIKSCDSTNLMDSSLGSSMELNTDGTIESNGIPSASQNRPKKRKKTKWRIVNDSSDEMISPVKSTKNPRLSDGSSEELSPSRSLVISFSKIKKSQYTCNCCSESFKKHQSLVHHLTNIHKNGPFLCTICNVEQSDALQLHLHLRQCNKIQLTDSSLQNLCSDNHAMSPPVLPLSCHKFDEINNEHKAGMYKLSTVSDDNKMGLSREVSVKNPGESTLEENDTSNYQLANDTRCNDQNAVNDHSLKDSITEEQNKCLNSPIASTNEHTACKKLPTNKSPAAPDCNLTKSKVCNKRTVKKRRTSHQVFSDSISKEEMSSVRKPTWVRKGGWKCEVCQKDFGAKGFLERHCIKSHGAPAKYNCPYCGKIFIDYRSLRTHHKAKHNRKKWLFEDKNVDKSSLHQLPKHIEKVSGSDMSDDQTILKKCTLCDKGFRRNIDLRRHKNRYHSNRTAVKCPICTLQFETKNDLAFHHSEIHEKEAVTAVVLQPMNQCHSSNSLDARPGPESSPSSALQDIEKSSSTSKEDSQNLQSEKNSSAGENKGEFQCADCPLAYKKYSCLKRHRILMHAEPASYYCTICGKGFSYPHSLKNHVMTHSRGELNSKRSDRASKGTWRKRISSEEKSNAQSEETCDNSESLDDSPGDGLHKPQLLIKPKSPMSPLKSAETNALFKTLEEPLSAAENGVPTLTQENGVRCINYNDPEMKSNENETFVPRSDKEACSIDYSNAPSHSEFREEPSDQNSHATMSTTDLNVPPAYPPWNGISDNAFSTSGFSINDNHWTPPFQTTEALNTCSICGLCLPSWYSLQEHYYIAHPNPNFYAPPNPNFYAPPNPNFYAPPVTYQTYPQEYATYNNYSAFYGGSFPISRASPPDNGSSTSFQELTSHSVAHCSVCGLCFPNLLALQEHYASHMVSLPAGNPVLQNSAFF